MRRNPLTVGDKRVSSVSYRTGKKGRKIREVKYNPRPTRFVKGSTEAKAWGAKMKAARNRARRAAGKSELSGAYYTLMPRSNPYGGIGPRTVNSIVKATAPEAYGDKAMTSKDVSAAIRRALNRKIQGKSLTGSGKRGRPKGKKNKKKNNGVSGMSLARMDSNDFGAILRQMSVTDIAKGTFAEFTSKDNLVDVGFGLAGAMLPGIVKAQLINRFAPKLIPYLEGKYKGVASDVILSLAAAILGQKLGLSTRNALEMVKGTTIVGLYNLTKDMGFLSGVDYGEDLGAVLLNPPASLQKGQEYKESSDPESEFFNPEQYETGKF